MHVMELNQVAALSDQFLDNFFELGMDNFIVTPSAPFNYNYEQGNPSPALSHKDILKIKVCEAIKWYVEKKADVSLRN